ncbi:MAG: anhydro-N-acetylmuramic acid kinase, partial [Candidatus Acidiferrales bacterium]
RESATRTTRSASGKQSGGMRASLEGIYSTAYPVKVREAILRIANVGPTTSAEISQLDFLLGELYARAVLAALKKFRVAPSNISLIGSHGQTIYHQGAPLNFLGAALVSSTFQIGEPAMIAARTGITTVGDFRPADIAAGGQGAPLVPFVDYIIYRDAKLGRVALNIGGIANFTVIPANAAPKQVMAFDTGPGNMLVDSLVRHFSRGRATFDRDAKLALRGATQSRLLEMLLMHPYLRLNPPKTAGREQFGDAFAREIVKWGASHRTRPNDLIHTATLFTPLSIAEALHRFVLPRAKVHELIVSGGGARNPLMMAQLAASLPGIEIRTSDEFGIPIQAKEAFAFAILAYEAFHQRANNLPSATGARRPAVLGKICYARPR